MGSEGPLHVCEAMPGPPTLLVDSKAGIFGLRMEIRAWDASAVPINPSLDIWLILLGSGARAPTLQTSAAFGSLSNLRALSRTSEHPPTYSGRPRNALLFW